MIGQEVYYFSIEQCPILIPGAAKDQRPPRPPFDEEEAVTLRIDALTMKEVEASRALVREHMCDLMKSVTRNKSSIAGDKPSIPPTSTVAEFLLVCGACNEHR